MNVDEVGTLAALKVHQAQFIDPTIAEYHGRIVKLMGDGMLAEFGSVIDAVECAVALQRGMAARNKDVPEGKHIQFRVGINLGDVIIDGEDIYGDGVNVAACLEGLAEADGICISGNVHDQLAGKTDIAFEDTGEQTVMNITKPVRVWRWRLKAGADLPSPSSETERVPLSEKPSIAVLPFLNMSGDPEQEFFTDGITEDIITELARFRHLLVISRTSTFALKGKAASTQDVAKELNVQFVVEGSVRKAGNRVRVTVQLIDVETDRHVWANRYDRELEDIFAIQDELTQAIAATLPGRVEAATRERAERKPTNNMAAYEYVLAGKLLHHRSTKEDNVKALAMLDRAIKLDPNYAHAHAWKACALGQAWIHGYCDDPEATQEQVAQELQTALTLDDNDGDVHRVLAALSLVYEDHDKAMYHQERALSLNPNDDLIVVQQGEILTWLGKPEKGIEWIKHAMRLNPYHPERFWNHLGRAYYVARRYAEAIEAFKHISAPDHTHHAFLAASYAQMGDDGTAQAHAQEVRKREPEFSVENYLATLHYKHDGDREHHREGLVKAGLAE
jgi:adenylate cyclase